jgi:hypothetical protein
MASITKPLSKKHYETTLVLIIFVAIVLSFPSNIIQNVFSSSTIQQQPETESENQSSLSINRPNESGTIQCITTPCEFPSPKPIPPISDNNSTLPQPTPTNNTQSPEVPQNNPEPCISPCPPGEVCIQMCKPVGQLETSITESDSPSERQEGQQNEPTLILDESSENTGSTNEGQDSTNANNEDNNQDRSEEITDSSE